jgi:tripartite ATP-independent transporter DctM subunit
MEWYWAFALILGMVVLMLGLGFPVALAFIVTNIIGWLWFSGFNPDSILQVIENSTILISRFTLAPVPMFIMMGSLFFYTGLAVRVFDAIEVLFGRLPGRLAYLTVAGGALFATLTGSSMANTAMLGSLMVPEMQRRGYSPGMSMGPVLGSGGLAMIIPPSALGVLLAAIAGIDVGQLLVAGFIPGFLLAGLFGLMIWLRLTINPSEAPAYDVERVPWSERGRLIVINILPMSIIVFMVVGFIILGWATPTEAAAMGVLGVMILAALWGKLTLQSMLASIDATVRVAGMVFFILMNSTVFSQLLAFSGASAGLLQWVSGLGLPPLAILFAMFCVLVLLGMFMDGVSMMLIAVPIFFPLAKHMGYDPIWYGLFMLLTIEMGGLTPPFGLSLYVMLGIAPPGTTLPRVAKAAFPYLVCDVILILILVAFPGIALFLPRLMG